MNAFKILHWALLNSFGNCLSILNIVALFFSFLGLSVNTTLSGPLLSRFDIVLVLLDGQNPEWDEIVSSHILNEVNCFAI
jgi:hypothetical protein